MQAFHRTVWCFHSSPSSLVDGAEVNCVSNLTLPGIHMSQNFVWTVICFTWLLVKCLFVVSLLKKSHASSDILINFYRCTIESTRTNSVIQKLLCSDFLCHCAHTHTQIVLDGNVSAVLSLWGVDTTQTHLVYYRGSALWSLPLCLTLYPSFCLDQLHWST